MSNRDRDRDRDRERSFRRRARRSHSNFPIGIVLLLIGGAFMARQFGADFPSWFFSWEMLIIAIGIVIGFQTKFRDFGWLIMIAVGLAFLVDDFYPIKNFMWPALIIIVGLLIILKPRWQFRVPQNDDTTKPTAEASEGIGVNLSLPGEASQVKEEVLDITSVFGGTKKIVLSKNFKGGEVVSVFGGADINLTQADFNGIIRIEIVAIFGGATLVVPANWEVRSETVAIMGAVDDKRSPIANSNPEKIVILEGTVMFGGIEIKSY